MIHKVEKNEREPTPTSVGLGSRSLPLYTISHRPPTNGRSFYVHAKKSL